MQEQATSVYYALDPDTILAAVESCGYLCDGRLLALNSYENRVYQVGIEAAEPLVAKFYRPQRWTDQAIREEQRFATELLEAEIPVVAPIADAAGETLFSYQGFRFSLYPRQGGHAPELDSEAHLQQLGRFMARLHNVGDTAVFEHRPSLSIDEFGHQAREFLLHCGLVPAELLPAYAQLSSDLLFAVEAAFKRTGSVHQTRLHGDSHPGNILHREQRFHIVDLDDARNGPAIQDLWMFLSGEREQQMQALAPVLRGYRQFRPFNPAELGLIEPLRSLRQMHFAAWLARRWEDPAFPQAFPWFATARFWEEHILGLKEQLAALQEPPLTDPDREGNY